MQIALSDINPLNLKITAPIGQLREIKEYFTEFSPGYEFDWRYKAGRWNGKISLFDKNHRELPYGLLGELLKFKKSYYPDEEWIYSEDVKQLFKGVKNITPKYDLKLYPYDYQQEVIEKALKYKSCCFLASTGSGKSIMITYIWKTLFENALINKTVIIVPNLNLITQFHNDLIDYGVNPDIIGEVWAKEKQWEKQIVVSTWQSLVKFPKECQLFDCVFVDEVHGFKSYNAKELLQKITNAKWRFGCTGTLPESSLDNLNVISYLGPVCIEVKTDFLVEKKAITQACIKQIELNYKKVWDKPIAGVKPTYQEVKDAIFHSNFRLHIIAEYLKQIEDNIKLLLVTKVESEGQFLKDYLLGIEELSDHEIIFMSGQTKKEEREEIRQKCIKNDHKIILVCTFPIIQAGVNIPALGHVFFVSASKSKVRILQAVGRSLRLYSTKKTAYIYDFIDNQNRFFGKQALKREKFYDYSGFSLEHYEHNEKDFDKLI